MSFLGTLGKIALGVGGAVAAPFTGGTSLMAALPAIAGGVGAALGGASQASANNRGNQIDAALAQQQLEEQQFRDATTAALQREQLRQQGVQIAGQQRKDALKQAQYADYIANGTHDYTPPTVRGGTLPTYGFGPRAATPAMRDAALAAGAAALNTIHSGGGTDLPEITPPAPFTIDPSLLHGGAFENVAGWLAPALTAVSNITRPKADPYAGLDPIQRATVIAALKRYGIDDSK